MSGIVVYVIAAVALFSLGAYGRYLKIRSRLKRQKYDPFQPRYQVIQTRPKREDRQQKRILHIKRNFGLNTGRYRLLAKAAVNPKI
jgi:hypothetical protein